MCSKKTDDMKSIIPLLLVVLAFSCTSKKHHQIIDVDPFPVRYENELFAMSLPEGWVIDDSGWQGLDSMNNEVDFYNPNDDAVFFHLVKTYFPFQWKSLAEATEFAKAARAISGDSVSLIEEMDSVTVSGYPAKILMFANFVGNDTIIQKQYVTYLQKTHTLLYLNENFLYHNWEKGQRVGDELMNNLIIKDVKNPIDKKYNKRDSFKQKNEKKEI
jgi:hypothetical protein